MSYERVSLLLNADMTPLSWAPLSVLSWRDSVWGVLKGKLRPISYYENEFISTPHEKFQVPSVVSLYKYSRPRGVKFTRRNVFIRDQMKCQYCGNDFCTSDLTFDHVVPRSMGGKSSWTNIASACASCNLKKANRSLSKSGMKLLRQPWEPGVEEFKNLSRIVAEKSGGLNVHETWVDFLYWDTELES